jgi:acyl dehydratase
VLSLDEALAAGRPYIGQLGKAVTMTVEASQIRLFADAIGDPDPLYRDQEYARRTRWGGIIAPPTFLCILFPPVPMPRIDYGVVLNGGTTFELARPVRVGDVVCGQASVRDVRAVDGRSGSMLIVEREIQYSNADGQHIGRCIATIIQR